MRKGKYAVKRLTSVLLGASLAMGAPGSAMVSVASEVDGIEAVQAPSEDADSQPASGEQTADGETVLSEQADAGETVLNEQADAEGAEISGGNSDEITENPEGSDNNGAQEQSSAGEESSDAEGENTSSENGEAANEEAADEEAQNLDGDEEQSVGDSDADEKDLLLLNEQPDADNDSGIEAKKQAAKDKQKHPKENINSSADVNRASIHDGTILHAFCWNFNTIKENMKAIADAGFTAIQTSPANACLDTHPALSLDGTKNNTDGMWYYHYQPTDWTIGNYQLGSRDEFIAMCNEADKYGIGIIVDILPNHTTPTVEAVSENMIDAVGGWDNLFHKDYTTDISNWSDRKQVTYNAMGGLFDVDTENTDFQEYFYAYLDDCINCGADGFRIDTAKHIALPDDPVPANYAGEEGRNNFYPNMEAAIDAYAAETGNGKNYDNLFVYGEVLQGDGDRLAAYQEYIGGTTASNYGGTIRTSIAGNNVVASKFLGYGISDDGSYKADSNKLVTWVESHDNYINDGSYNAIDDKDTVEAWAIIAARKDGTPLFFSRPSGSSAENPFGDNVLGKAGNDLFKSPEVTAVNKFRTAMKGKGENLSNPGGDSHVLMVERGDEFAEGAVLVNTANYPIAITGETTLPDGNYINSVDGKSDLFIVKDGKIDGVIQKEAVVVLTEAANVNYTAVHFNNSKNWDKVQAYIDGSETPVDALSENDGWFRVNVSSENFEIAFSNGTDRTAAYTITDGKDGFVTPEKTEVFESKAMTDEALGLVTDSVYLFNTELWENANIYSWFDNEFSEIAGGWPGKNTYDDGGYWIRADLKLPKDRAEESYNVIFNTDGTQTANIAISGDKKYIALTDKDSQGHWNYEQFSSKAEAEEKLGISANKTTVYYYNKNGWEDVYAYTWDAYSFGEWPGVPCEDEGDGWWKVTVPAAAGANFYIIFNNNNNGSQTTNLVIPDIKNRFVVGNRIYGSKEEAVNPPEEEEFVVTPAYPEGTPVTRIYYYDDNDWGRVDAYIWGGAGNKYNDVLGKWPGTRMYSEKNGWYYTDVPTEAMEGGNLHLILNYNGSSQLEDKIIDDTTKVYFNTPKTNGYDSKDNAIDGKTAENPTEEPGTEQPGTEQPGTEQPGTEQPGAEQPGTEQPGAEQPGTEQPGTEQPGTEQPATETPGTTKPETPSDTKPETPSNTTPETPATSEGANSESTPKTPETTSPATTKPDVNEGSSQSVTKPDTSEGTVPATPEASAESENPVTVDVSKKDVPVTGIKLDKKKVKVGVTGKYQLTAKILPGDATNKKLTWTTSDKKIAEVTSNGLVKAKKIGDCVITVTSKDGSFKAECKVTVTKKVKVEGVKLNKTKKNLTAGDKFTLKATLKPKKATNQDVKWSSSNTKVATVDANGNVKALSKGEATITVTTKEGKFTDSCKITVKKAKTSKKEKNTKSNKKESGTKKKTSTKK